MLTDAEKILHQYCLGKKVAVAVSGGADSMALLYYLLHSDSVDKASLIVVNVNHNIRGKSSDDDSYFVKAKCSEFGVRLTTLSVDVPSRHAASGRSIELEAREARRELYIDLVNTGVANMVLTAHHASDNAETILMRALRGTGLKGLSGIKICSENAMILRPFLNVTKEEILEYITENNIEYVTDESNFDETYDRNFIRLKLMPLIKTRWAGAEKALNRLASLATQSCEIIDSCIDESNFIFDEGNIKIKIESLNKSALAAAYVSAAIKKLGVSEDVYSKNIQEVLSLLNCENGAKVCVGQGYTAAREYSYITIGKFDSALKSNDETSVKIGDNIFDGQKITIAKISKPKAEQYIQKIKSGNKCALVFDSSKLPIGAVLRYRRDGDIFTDFGGTTKKLKEFLINKKIPSRLRDNIPLICYNNNVLVIVGIEISSSIGYANNIGEPCAISLNCK